MKEQNVLKTILLAVCKGPTRVWRNNSGMAWVGDVVRVNKRDILLKNARPLRAGFKGISDLIGYTSVTICPEDVGKTMAVFTAIEVKAAKGRATKEQVAFLARVKDAGGYAGVARSPEDAEKIIKK